MKTFKHFVPNGDGWTLSLKQVYEPGRLNGSSRPVLIVPGYGMNSYIFGFHPTGLSMEEYFAEAGLEVWSVNLRGQGDSVPTGAITKYGLRELATVDLAATLRYISQTTQCSQKRVDAIGCSLGGTLLFINAALVPDTPLWSIIAMGSPLRWISIHPLLGIAFCSPAIIGLISFKFTRTLARCAIPVVKRIPWILSVYLHPEHVDLSQPDRLAQTVEDPVNQVNREISEWINNKDLIIDGKNITEAFKQFSKPLLCVVANRDGIVPEDTAIFPLTVTQSSVKEILRVGTETIAMAHADMFISDHAQELAFRPLTAWLLRSAES